MPLIEEKKLAGCGIAYQCLHNKSVKKTVLNEWKAMRKAMGLEKGKLQYTTHIVVFC